MKITTIGSSILHLCDCMDLMKQYPDNHFDLAIVDPPYGGGGGGSIPGRGKGEATPFWGPLCKV